MSLERLAAGWLSSPIYKGSWDANDAQGNQQYITSRLEAQRAYVNARDVADETSRS